MSRWLLPSLASLCLASACSSPRITRDFEEASDTVELSLGPLPLGGLSRMTLSAAFSSYDVKPVEATYIDARFSLSDFHAVHFFADGRKYSYPRLLFEESSVRIPLEEFLSIGSASHVAVGFDTLDDPAAPLRLDPAHLRLLHRFTTEAEYHYERARRERRG